MDLNKIELQEVQLEILKADDNHILFHEKSFPAWKYIYLLPFPYFSLGFCSNELLYETFTFNTKDKIVRIVSKRPPYCSGCARITEISFNDIDRIGYDYSVYYNSRDLRSYFYLVPTLITKDETKYFLGDRVCVENTTDAISSKKMILELHRFVFEQKDTHTDYIIPKFSSLGCLN